MSSPPSLSPPSLQHGGRSSQCHSTEDQSCETQSPGPYPFEFPLRVIPPGYDRHPGPRSPIEAYQKAQRWIKWYSSTKVTGAWRYDWLKTPTPEDVSLLVEEMVARGILPDCFSMVGTRDDVNQEARMAWIEAFNSGHHNVLYTLHCRCFLTSKEEQSSEACSSPPAPSQPCCKVGPQKPPNSSSPCAPPACRSTLLHHKGGGGSGVVEDKFDNRHIPGQILLRLALPVDPYFHVESGVATAHFARVRGIPVPRIYAYDSSAVNCLGIEWQLVEKIPEADCNFIDTIVEEEEEALGPPRPYSRTRRSAAWTRLGRQLEETVALLRSEGHHSSRGRSSDACFDRIGSLYWDFEKRDFVLGPVSDRRFTEGRRILYYQRHDGDRGDPKFPMQRGPFRSVREYLNAALALHLQEANDESLRVGDGQPNPSKGPDSSEVDDTTTETTSAPSGETDTNASSGDDDNRPQGWYTEADVEIVHDQVSKLRDIIIPWLLAKLRPEQQERMRTYISHRSLHNENLLVSRRAQTQLERDEVSINVLGEEYGISAVLDWEHIVALPDYLIDAVQVAGHFARVLPTVECPDFYSVLLIEGYLNDKLDGGRAAGSPWGSTCQICDRSVPEGLVPWRSGDDSGGPSAAVESAGSGGNGSSNIDGVRGAGSGMPRREATSRSLTTPPRKITNAEVLLHLVFDCIDGPVGRFSEKLVNPLAEWIQAHSTSEGEE